MDKLQEIKERHNSSINSFVDGNDIEWLIEQAEKLEEIRKAFYDKDTDVVECYRKQIEIFEGKETPSRRARP